ncbi:hypothetical protein JCM3770_006674 [Rhodotorula araucariae]
MSTQTALEASLKATRVQLSRILAFQAKLQHHGALDYAHALPSQLARPLDAEAATFASICDQLERRVLRAIAVLERDARRAAGVSPLPAAPSPLAAPPPAALAPLSVTADATAPPPAPLQLDLTLSPSPPPTAGLPFQLPASAVSTALGAQAQTAMLDLTGDDSVASSTTGIAAVDADAGAGADPNDDINALLASLNMPPFDLSSASSAAGPPGPSVPAASAPGTAPPGAFPDLSLDALNALMAGTTAPAAAAAPATGRSPSSAPAGTGAGLDALGLSLALGAGGDGGGASAGGASGAPGASDFAAIDFSSFGGGVGAGAGSSTATATATGTATDQGFGALGELLDFTSFAAAPAASSAAAAATTTTTAASGLENDSLEELLKSLGGGV